MDHLPFWIKARLPVLQARVEHYAPLMVWMFVILTLCFIPFKIVSLGFMPPDDALRHVAKVISGKSWQEILVMPKDLTIDHHAGWHAILGFMYRTFHLDADTLVVFSMVGLYILFAFSLFTSSRRAEAVILMMVLSLVTIPAYVYRQMLGRPFLVPMAMLVVLLPLWTNKNRITISRLTVTTLLLTVAIWIHGSWFVYPLLLAAFFLSGYFRQGFALTGCWLVGSFVAALLTGQPIDFFVQQIKHLTLSYSGQWLQRMLVSEAQPSDGDFSFVVAVVVLIIFQKQLLGRWDKSNFLNPSFILGLLGWILGFKILRLWLDWGLPAMMVWTAVQIQTILVWKVGYTSLRRLAFTSLACLTLFLASTSDLGGRWTNNLTDVHLSAEDKKIVDWLPGKGGIFYSVDMGVFYQTFYKNPHAPWRYVLGFEAGFMLPEDREIFRNIQWRYLDAAYDPWVKKMRPEDRLVIRGISSVKPSIPKLEWAYVIHRTWIGRLPKEKPPAASEKKNEENKQETQIQSPVGPLSNGIPPFTRNN